MTGRSVVEFEPLAPYELRSEDGRYLARGDSGDRWIAAVQSSSPGRAVYRLVAGSMSTRERARRKAREVESFGYATEIVTAGGERAGMPDRAAGVRTYRILLRKVFESEAAARAFRDSIRFRFESFPVRELAEEPSGLIVLHNETRNLRFETSRGAAVIGSPVRLYGVPVGTGFHWEQKEDRTYPASVGVRLDAEGKLAAVNTLPIESYLDGVVPSEMHPGFPEEALKAQAVAARSKALSTLGLVHAADPFDFCADVHCQAYSGLSRAQASTRKAVSKTAGLVLWEDGRVADAVYGSVCGGHTEDVDKAWLTAPKAHLRGIPDGPRSLRDYGPLDEEANVRRWIADAPPAFCNSASGECPAALEYTRKYFRWETTLSQADLRAQVEKRCGRSLGEIFDLVPLSRGVSGRITRLKILGSEGEWTVEGELAVRRALSATTLWSACFTAERREGGAFLLRGAGWGHGVGMCQTGAARLALEGRRFDYILKHYYAKAQIKRLY
jgi:SpoIID/LytB domain protein